MQIKCKNIIVGRIDVIALNRWYTDLSLSSLCTVHYFRQFTQQLCFEKYSLKCLTPERGFHKQNIDVQIVNYQYICTFTCMSQICVLGATLITKVMNTTILWYIKFFRKDRDLYLKRYYYTTPSIDKFVNLFCSMNKRTQRRLAKLVKRAHVKCHDGSTRMNCTSASLSRMVYISLRNCPHRLKNKTFCEVHITPILSLTQIIITNSLA